MCIRDEHVCVHVCGACVQPGLRKHSSEPRMFLLLVSLYLVSGSLKPCFSLSISDTVLERQGSLNLALSPMPSLRMKLRLRASKR